MDKETIKLKLEEMGLEADLADDIVSDFEVPQQDNNEDEVRDVVAQLRMKYDNEADPLKKAGIMAKLMSYRLDKADY
jgi:hypothetical protein